jgi:hypothetical protein
MKWKKAIDCLWEYGFTRCNEQGSKIFKATMLVTAALAMGISSCKKHLDIIPDNVPTIEHVFKLRNEAEKYLFTCYSYLPRNGDGRENPGFMAGDEMWLPEEATDHWHPLFRIARGEQNKDAPLFSVWSIGQQWRAIRHCNIFLENMKDLTKVPDISLGERERWIGEVEFLKAYYHFNMLRMYGPIPIVQVNLGDDADITGLYSKRMPVDSCVDFISRLLDTAYQKLPPIIADENNELGRITQSVVLAVKAKLWAMAASPLFNGNPDYASFKDKQGKALFSTNIDISKWEKARDAALAAIQFAEANGHGLYEYGPDFLGLTDTTKRQLSIRNAVTGRWSREHVWANSQSYFANEDMCMPPTERSSTGGVSTVRFDLKGVWAPPIKIAKMFYTQNGVPIEEDKTLNFSDYEQIRTATSHERNYIEPNFRTARLNFDREPRFYASLGFDGGVWYMKDGTGNGSDRNTFFVRAKNSERAGLGHFTNWNETGYFIKKLVHWESTSNARVGWRRYPWPEIRLADLYLLYAEALNEVEPASANAIQYVDKIRRRAGLKGVVESWTNYSTNSSKFSTQSGLREIIHQERLIELAFEGHRFWDLRRWKKAYDELNKDITGWNIASKNDTYYKERLVFSQRFIAPRDYFWPIGNFEIRRNPQMVENPGW